MLTSDAFSSVFWSIIDEARGDEEKLKAILASESRIIVIDFYKTFLKAISNLEEILCGVGASEDYRTDVFTLIVSKGRDYYDKIVKHPELVPAEIDPGGPCFLDVAGEV